MSSSTAIYQYFVDSLSSMRTANDTNLLLSILNNFGCLFYTNELSMLLSSELCGNLQNILYKTNSITVSQIIIRIYRTLFNQISHSDNSEISSALKNKLFNVLYNELSTVLQHYNSFISLTTNYTIDRKFFTSINNNLDHPLDELIQLLISILSNTKVNFISEFQQSKWIKLLFSFFKIDNENIHISTMRIFRLLLPQINPNDLKFTNPNSSDQQQQQPPVYPILNNAKDIIISFINISSLLYPCESDLPVLFTDLEHIQVPFITSEIVTLMRTLQERNENWAKLIDEVIYNVFTDLSKNINKINNVEEYVGIQPIISKSIICFYIIGNHIGQIYVNSKVKVIEHHEGQGYEGIVKSIDRKHSTCEVEKISIILNDTEPPEVNTCCVDDLRSIPEHLAEPTKISTKTFELLVDNIITPLFKYFDEDNKSNNNTHFIFTKNYLTILSVYSLESLLFCKKHMDIFSSNKNHCKLLTYIINISLLTTNTYGLPDLVDIEECYRLLLFKWIDMQLYILSNGIDTTNLYINNNNDINSDNNNISTTPTDDPEFAMNLALLVSLGFDNEEAKRLLVENNGNVDEIIDNRYKEKPVPEPYNLSTSNSNTNSIMRVDSIVTRGKYLTEVCGLGKIDDYTAFALTTSKDFVSAGIPSAIISEGKWYYEVTIIECDIVQIGWADSSFFGVLQTGQGVGDDSHSWAYDGVRECKWSLDQSKYGLKWKKGDVIGCYIDLDERKIGFSLNGNTSKPMGIAFEGILFDNYVYPCISLNRGSGARFNIGLNKSEPLKYLPLGYQPISNCCNLQREIFGRSMCEYSEELNDIEDHFSLENDEKLFYGRYFNLELNSFTCASIDYHLIRQFAGLQTYSDSRYKAMTALSKVKDYNIIISPLINLSTRYIKLLMRQLILIIMRTWPIEDITNRSFVDTYYQILQQNNENNITESGCIDRLFDVYKMLTNYPLRTVEFTSYYVNSDIPKYDDISDYATPNDILKVFTYAELKSRILSGNLNSILIRRLLYKLTLEIGESSKTKNANSPWIFATQNKSFSGFSGDKNWKDDQAIITPCLPMSEWITHLFLRLCSMSNKYHNQIILSVFNAWCIALRSPSMVLRSKSMSVLYSILNEQLAVIITNRNPMSSEQEQFINNLLKCVAYKRLKGQLEMKLYTERDRSPCYSAYTLNLLELVTVISNIKSYLENNKDFEKSLVRIDNWSDGFEIGVPSDDTDSVKLSGWLNQPPIFKSESPDIKIGDHVIRGPDWDWTNQDNEGIGIVTAIDVFKSTTPGADPGESGLTVTVKWEAGNTYKYRWCNEKYDLVIVDVNDRNQIIKRYPVPRDCKYRGSFSKELKTGVRLIINKISYPLKEPQQIDGIIEFPQYNGRITINGKIQPNGTISFIEERFISGFCNRGWNTRFGTDHWRSGTKYTGTFKYINYKTLVINLTYVITINIDGKELHNMGKIGLRNTELFTFQKETLGNGVVLNSSNSTTAGITASTASKTNDVLKTEVDINIDGARSSIKQTMKGYQPISLGSVGFNNGINYWEINIDHTNQPGDIAVGIIANQTKPSDSCIPYQKLWRGNYYVSYRAIQENIRGAAIEKIYGTFYGSGDTIGVLLNSDKGFISFYYDGYKFAEHILSDLGPACTRLLNGKSYSSETVLYPHVCMKNKDEQITLNGKWFSMQGVSISQTLQEFRLAHSLIQFWLHKHGDKLPLSFLQESYEYYKRWISEKFKRYPIRVRGVECDFDVSDEAFKNLNCPFRAGNLVKILFCNDKKLETPEVAEILGVYNCRVWYRLCHTDSHEGLTNNIQNAWQFTAKELSFLELIDKKKTYKPNTDKVYTFEEYKNKIESIKWDLNIDEMIVNAMNKSCAKYAEIPENLSNSQFIWNDNNNNNPNSVKIDRDVAILRSTILVKFNTLISHVLPYIVFKSDSNKQSIVLKDESHSHSLFSPYNNISLRKNISPRELLISESEDGWLSYNLGQYLYDLKRILFTSTKKKFFDEILEETKTELKIPSDEYEDPREIQSLTINRLKAKPEILSSISDPIERMNQSVFGQLQRQMKDCPDSTYRIEYVCKGHGGQKRCFKVKFIGEGVNDYGGPYRTVFEDVVNELQNDHDLSESQNNPRKLIKPSCLLPFLIPTPNKFNNSGDSGRDRYIFNPSPNMKSNDNLGLLCYLGKLIGSSIRSGLQLALDLPELTWKILSRDSISIEDFKEIDYNTYKSLKDIESLEEKGITADTFEDVVGEIDNTMEISSGELLPLDIHHPDKIVNWEDRKRYVDYVLRNRIREATKQLQSFEAGLCVSLPLEILHLFTYEELENLISGCRVLNIEVLKQCTEYENIDPNANYIKWFWEVLNEMNEEQKVQFLKFVLARSRMPSSAKYFPMKFKVQRGSGKNIDEDPDSYMPHSQTCFFSLSLPAYTSKDILREKLLYAISNTVTMDADVQLHNGDGYNDLE